MAWKIAKPIRNGQGHHRKCSTADGLTPSGWHLPKINYTDSVYHSCVKPDFKLD